MGGVVCFPGDGLVAVGVDGGGQEIDRAEQEDYYAGQGNLLVFGG